MRFYLVLLLGLLGFRAWSQNGTITGTVTEKDNNGEPAYGAIVRVDSTKYGAPCDFDGSYKINLPPGTYTVSCKYTGYVPVTFTGVVVDAGKTTPLNIELTAASIIIGDTTKGFAVIYADRPKDAIAPMLKEIQEGNGSTEGTTKKEIAETTAPDAGQVAKKIPGVTLVDNRFIIIRGLSQRYNAVILNNILAPSVESDVKAFSFNLIPAPMIERFLIYKSPSADLPGEFSGGVVNLTTTEIPQKTSLNFNYQFGYRSGTTFQEFDINRVGNKDQFGLGLTTRALPAGFPSNVRNVTDPQLLQDLGRSFDNTWGTSSGHAQGDERFNLTCSYRHSNPAKFPAFQFGNVTSVNYSNTNQYTRQRIWDYNVVRSAGVDDTTVDYTDDNYVNSVRMAFVQNNAFRFGNAGQHRFTIKNLFNQLADNETSVRNGRNIEEGDFRKDYSFHYVQRTIYTGQIGGEHDFNNKRTLVDWTVGYSMGKRDDPDWRKARYSKIFGALDSDPYYLYVPFQAQPFFLSRLYVSMKEHTVAGAVNVVQKITVGADSAKSRKGFTFTIKTGVYYELKERAFQIRNIGYKAASFQTFGNYALMTEPIDSVFAMENINLIDGFALDEDTKPSDAYVASNDLTAVYLMTNLPFGSFRGKTDLKQHERIRVSIGTRMEKNTQQLNSNRPNGDTVIVNNDELRFLPSVNVTCNLTDRILVRAGYGRTVNRPEFREIAPLYFYDFINNSINVGNDTLKTAVIDNMDVRCEYYPRPGENITVGAFYKHFVNPIEMYFIPGVGGGGIHSFTWANAVDATNYGMEIEVRKKLDSLNIPVIRDLSIVGNAAYIFSDITLVNDYNGPEATHRPMMGQSPWIINAGLFYQNDSIGLQVNVMYNVIGPRVVVAGTYDAPEIYEMPHHEINCAIIKTLGKRKNIDMRVNITDLLNQDYLLIQDKDQDGVLDRENDNLMQQYKRGTYFTFGITFRLFEPKE